MKIKSKKQKNKKQNKKKIYKNYGGLIYLVHDGKNHVFKFIKIISDKKTKKKIKNKSLNIA